MLLLFRAGEPVHCLTSVTGTRAGRPQYFSSSVRQYRLVQGVWKCNFVSVHHLTSGYVLTIDGRELCTIYDVNVSSKQWVNYGVKAMTTEVYFHGSYYISMHESYDSTSL